ncbi:MAG: 23S rRNA 2'-O-ribose methyltransferase [Candidatus Westeberhardia cardiocondylae]|nr:23S rRNA 2'-O-ribose methyltransferase [Candidatus Westeberhardia cardiocondylae]
MIKNRSLSSLSWLRRHRNDIYVRKSKYHGFRSRSWFKISEIQKKDKIFYSGMVVIELGSSPGGWSQFILNEIGITGYLVSCDIIEMKVLEGMDFVHGNIYNLKTVNNILGKVKNRKVQVVLSDISPNLSGISIIDISKFTYLIKFLLCTFYDVISSRGKFLIKVFQGEDFEDSLKEISYLFKEVKIRKPKSSRFNSREVYIVATKK